MLDKIAELGSRASDELAGAGSAAELDDWRARYLSRKGEVKLLMREVGKIGDIEKKKRVGREINSLSQKLERELESRRDTLLAAERTRRLSREKVDISLPGVGIPQGRIHPVNRVLREVCDIFQKLGFGIFETPHAETDLNNFELLNIPKHHPAREMQDTFFAADDVVLRTHTTPGQIHAMRAFAPGPLRVIFPGTVYRNEAITPRSEIQFHQVDGLAIGRDISLADLRGVLTAFVHQFFGVDRRVLLRGSYFPFTEPSVEMDVECILCNGQGCRLCKESGWLEILGAGVVHPEVLRNGGYDPARAQGLAFGMGLERLVLLRHGIDDIRHFFANDLRFLEQFA